MTQSLSAYRAASLTEVAGITCIQQEEKTVTGEGADVERRNQAAGHLEEV